jgi:hypothetical protein
MATLVFTNGDTAADLLTEAGKDAVIEPWRDCLHLGPVPLTKSDKDLRHIRAKFLSVDFDDDEGEILAGLAARDGLIELHKKFDRIELWFEHDLYDQLQLIQILDMLANADRKEHVSIIQASVYLGMQTPETILDLASESVDVNGDMFADAQRVWRAFRADNPVKFSGCLSDEFPRLPFLNKAVARMLEELPGSDGLSRTERQMLYCISRGINRPGPLFARTMVMEEAAFWGDTGFFDVLSNLANGPEPLVEGLSEPFVPGLLQDDNRRKAFITGDIDLTDAALSVLRGEQDYTDLNPIDRWIGGTHVTNENLWRWNPETAKLTAP